MQSFGLGLMQLRWKGEIFQNTLELTNDSLTFRFAVHIVGSHQGKKRRDVITPSEQSMKWEFLTREDVAVLKFWSWNEGLSMDTLWNEGWAGTLFIDVTALTRAIHEPFIDLALLIGRLTHTRQAWTWPRPQLAFSALDIKTYPMALIEAFAVNSCAEIHQHRRCQLACCSAAIDPVQKPSDVHLRTRSTGIDSFHPGFTQLGYPSWTWHWWTAEEYTVD